MTQEQQDAKKIVELLNYGTARLDGTTAGRLAAVRKKAVAVAMERERVAHAEVATAGVGRFLVEHLHGQRSWMTVALLLGAALLTVLLVQQNFHREPVEGDALLLASDLPPEAYVDKGFDAWLEQSSQL